MMQCQICKNDVRVPKNRWATFKYCSRECSGKGQLSTVEAVCPICSNTFNHISCRATTAKYCSRECYYKAMVKVGTIERACKNCNTCFMTSPSRTKEFCSKKCVHEHRRKNFKDGAHMFGAVRAHMKTSGLLNKCVRCDYDSVPEILGVHHKDRNRDNNKLENLETLCPNCHSIEHMRHTPHQSVDYSLSKENTGDIVQRQLGACPGMPRSPVRSSITGSVSKR